MKVAVMRRSNCLRGRERSIALETATTPEIAAATPSMARKMRVWLPVKRYSSAVLIGLPAISSVDQASVLKLLWCRLLPELRLEQTGHRTRMMTGRCTWRCRIKTVKNKQIPFRVVHGRKSSDTLQMVERRQSIHLVIVHLVPRDVPARLVGTHPNSKVHRS